LKASPSGSEASSRGGTSRPRTPSGGRKPAKLTGYLIPQTCTLYTHEDPKALILRYRLRPDPTGTVEILKAFWDPALPQGPVPHEDVVHPLLVEADLKAIDDPRTNETARLIHDKFLA
jgi:hypothetical protein